MIGTRGCFETSDKRMFWCPYCTKHSIDTAALHYDVASQHNNLDDQWQLYYETKEMYYKNKQCKEKYDPDKIFSPNSFCIGGAKPSS